jgi:hypothetical protein
MIRCACGATVPTRIQAGHVVVCALQRIRRRQEAAVLAEALWREVVFG